MVFTNVAFAPGLSMEGGGYAWGLALGGSGTGPNNFLHVILRMIK